MPPESAIDRLKRIAREKEAAKKLATDSAGSGFGNSEEEKVADEQTRINSSHDSSSGSVLCDKQLENVAEVSTGSEKSNTGIVEQTVSQGNVIPVYDSSTVDDSGRIQAGSNNVPECIESPTPRNHPLSMQFAELEQHLVAGDPSFKVLLRDIHRHLGMEPELVTMMTEEEVQLVVSGMVHFANAEIVEPAKAKAAKSAVTAAKKKVITEDDL